MHLYGPNWTTLTSTPLVGPDAAFCAAIGYKDARRFCPPRTEGGPDAQAEIGACNALIVGAMPEWPKWYWDVQYVPEDGLGIGIAHHENPYNLRVRPALHGTAKVCGRDGVCGELIL